MSQRFRRITTSVLIISYETFRLHATILHGEPIGLVICDEVTLYSLIRHVSSMYRVIV